MKMQDTRQDHSQATTRSFRFEFCTGEKLFRVSFQGFIPEPEIRGMLEAARRALYETCGNAIRSYLDTHRLQYRDFTSECIPLETNTVTTAVERLLHDSSCAGLDAWTDGADTYYGIMDYQSQPDRSCYESCYSALSKTPSWQAGAYQYHIIGQSFRSDEADSSGQSCFAIRIAEDGKRLHTVDGEMDHPVLASFGCVDLFGLLIYIRTIRTKQQAAELANK